MKLRTDFVTNSSSSSFILQYKNLTAGQMKRIEELCKDYDWKFNYNDNKFNSWTIMDNGELGELLDEMNIPKHLYAFDDSYHFGYDDEDEEDEN